MNKNTPPCINCRRRPLHQTSDQRKPFPAFAWAAKSANPSAEGAACSCRRHNRKLARHAVSGGVLKRKPVLKGRRKHWNDVGAWKIPSSFQDKSTRHGKSSPASSSAAPAGLEWFWDGLPAAKAAGYFHPSLRDCGRAEICRRTGVLTKTRC